MAEAGDEWELCKENVQPLRQGRVMSTLQEVLSQQESASHTVIQQEKQAFELELRFYNGDDPLDVWDRYIKWAEQAFPQGGKESNLAPLLERAVKIFIEDKNYYDDLRYLGIWLKFAHFCSEPLDLYSYLHSQGIGISHALLYIAWAEEYEAQGNCKKADSVFQEGTQRKAEPMEKLEMHHRQFQARVSRQAVQGISEGADTEETVITEPQRSSLVDLKFRGKNKARAPVGRVGEFTKPRSQSLAQVGPPQQIPARSRIMVFDENAMAPVASGPTVLNPQPWAAIPPPRAKENEQHAGRWNSGRASRNSQSTANSEVPVTTAPSFTPYVDEVAEQQIVTPCKINPTITSVLSTRKPSKEEDPLQRVQKSSEGKEEMVMYCKSKVYAGMEEFSLEEIRAEIYMVKLRKKREEELQACAQRRLEMERKIEEMERMLKEAGLRLDKKVNEQASPEEAGTASCLHSIGLDSSNVQGVVEYPAASETVFGATGGRCLFPVSPKTGDLSVQNTEKNQPSTLDLVPGSSSNVPFTVFDESCNIPSNVTGVWSVSNVQQNQTISLALAQTSSTNVQFAIFDESCHIQPNTTGVLSVPTEQQNQTVSIDNAPTSSSNLPFAIFDESCDMQPGTTGIWSEQEVQQNQHTSIDLSHTSSSNVPFTIFDESCDLHRNVSAKNMMPPPVRRPLSVNRPKSFHEHSLLKDALYGIEPLNEDAIVCGSHENKSLIPDLEDTCEFVRAAQLASTPFHKPRDELEQSAQGSTSDMERLPLREKTPVCEESYLKQHCIKKLSPILEASREDARTSLSSVSSMSSNSHSTSTLHSKMQPVLENFNSALITGVCELTPEDTVHPVEIADLHMQLLEPMYELLASAEIQHGVESLPVMKDQADVTLGDETLSLKREIPLGEKTKLYIGYPAGFDSCGIKVALKVEYQPVPWDFYILLQLKERLGECFETNFLEQSNCYLFKDGCIMLYRNINCFSVESILQDPEEDTDEMILLIAYNLLDLVEKLHNVEIVHGDLRPETLLLDDRVFSLSSDTEMTGLLKLIDFSSSMDLRLCPTMNLHGFPVAQTKHGQQYLAHRTSPYQVDIFGIADLVHFMIFRKPLQLHEENSTWKIMESIPCRCSYRKYWDTFFAMILNRDEPTASLLRDLKVEITQLFDGCFEKKISNYLSKLIMCLDSDE
ncbi:mitotic checkpoint serine/threonine-protein kinase BUB1 beta [Pelobates fuscus]|uniref:mitotic checkpoint serine/threonine-protein kinase BUB1 beta n=1 Tax=Pelobates fuscus TaxID=191477 RepID=UPI002FE47DBC